LARRSSSFARRDRFSSSRSDVEVKLRPSAAIGLVLTRCATLRVHPQIGGDAGDRPIALRRQPAPSLH
jgi:hypothetical protein